MHMLIDKCNRKIDYLRISVTDRCNLRCIYCMPECGIIHKPHEELLSFEEIIQIVKAGVELGIDKIRLTGGEPLVRKGLVDLIRLLNDIEGIKDISLTTNGFLLKDYALPLKKAGLKRLNVSLDTLREDRYSLITRGANLEDVLEGISKSMEVGFLPLKINVLLLDDIDEAEIRNFLRLTLENPVCVRFLEFMPVNSFYAEVCRNHRHPEASGSACRRNASKDSYIRHKKGKNFVSSQFVMEVAKRFLKIQETQNLGNGPAKVYKFKSALGTFGIISPLSNKFCVTCNRLRLTANGFLKPCLNSELKVNLRQPLRRGADKEELIKLIKLAVTLKPKEHSLDKNTVLASEFSMCQIGG